jgi:hypothetical protein
MVTDLAHEGKTSPSKLLLPLSYASMFGGTLTLIGTSTNILASDLSARLAAQNPAEFGELHAFSMFEFTALGILVSIVGAAYLMTVGRWLTRARIPPREDLTEEFELEEYLTEVVVIEDSPLVGRTVAAALDETQFDVDLVQLLRGDKTFAEPLGAKRIRADDVFALRTDRETLVGLIDTEGLQLLPEVNVTDAELEGGDTERSLVEVVIAPDHRWSASRSPRPTSATGTTPRCWPFGAAWSTSASAWRTPSCKSATHCSCWRLPTASRGPTSTATSS